MSQVLMINGSYRDGGITDQALTVLRESLRQRQISVEEVRLRHCQIGFCRNCRACTQQPGSAPGHCVQPDEMQALIDRIEAADGYVFAAPTNFGTVTALFKRFQERLIVYGYYPWGQHAPKPRRKPLNKPALVISACAAPGLAGRLLFTSLRQLKQAVSTVGARTLGSMQIGLVGSQPDAVLTARTRKRLTQLAASLARRLE